MSGEQDWLDYAQKLGPAFSAFASSTAAVIALAVAFRGRKQTRSEQAQRITAWLNSEGIDIEGEDDGQLYLGVKINNASQQAAYDVVVRLVRVPNGPNRSCFPELGENDIDDTKYIRALPPGERTLVMRHSGSGMHKRYGVDFALQDAAGVYWYRNSVGMLSRILKHPVEFFGLSWPMGWGD